MLGLLERQVDPEIKCDFFIFNAETRSGASQGPFE